MKAQQVAVLFLAVCVVCCAAHRDPTYGDDYDNGKAYKDGKPGYKYNGGKEYKGEKYNPKEYTGEKYDGKEYKPKEYDSEEYNGKQYKGKQYKPKEYDSEEYKGKQYKPKEYNGKKYEGKEDYYEGKEDYYKGGKDEYYGEDKYGYDDYEKKPEVPDYGPVYNGPKAYENYEYDSYKTEYPGYGPEYPEYENHDNYGEGYGGYGEGYGEGYEGYEGYDGYGGNPDCPVPCDNPHAWPWGSTYLCINPYEATCVKYNASACSNTGAKGADGNVCIRWGMSQYACLFKPSGADKKCRPKAGPCDETEYCPGPNGGLPGKCPDNTFKPNTVYCKHPEGPCESPAKCPGNSATCTPDYKTLNGTRCSPKGTYGYYGPFRPIKGPCDADDVCNGKTADCPDTKFGPEKKCKDKSSAACDLDDFCNGKDDTCPDKVKAKGEICNSKINIDPAKNKPCITGGRCTGSTTDKTCPPLKHVATGTPCNKDGLWTEAYDVEGNVAVKSKHTKEHADMHGWVECDRCYEGECQHFKWEYWNADGDGDHKSSSSPKSSGSHSSSSKKSGHKSSSYKSHKAEIASVNEDADNEVLPADGFYPTKIFQTLGVPDPTKASIQSGDYGYGEGHEGHHKAIAAYEPELYCHNPFVTKDYTR